MRIGQRGRVLAAAVCLVSGVALCHAQRIFRGVTDLVILPVTVTDHGDHLVGGLNQNDFQVFEDGAPQSIKAFSRDPQPIALSLLIDTSASMEPRMDVVKAAATGFVRRLGARDVAQVIAFDSQAQVLQPFTADQPALERAIRSTKAGGSTSLYMAVYIALNDLESVHAKTATDATAEAQTGATDLHRQAIVLLSDGEDTSSLLDYESVEDRAKRSDVTIYAIGLKTGEAPKGFNEGEFVLRSLTQDTGGRAYFVAKMDDLGTVYQAIADELANQYMIGYTSSNHRLDGAWRQVAVRVDHPETIARTKSGYFGPQGSR